MGTIHTLERPTSPFSITSSSSSSILDFYTRLTPKAQPTTTLSSIVVSCSDSGSASDLARHRNASLRLKSMMKLSRYDDEKKLRDSDDSDDSNSNNNDDDMVRDRRPRYPSFPVGRLMSSFARNFPASSSSRPLSSPPSHLRPPRIIITPPPSPNKPRSPSNSNSNSHATNSTLIMNPILAKLERESKLCGAQVVCSTCGKIGRGYPRCGRCGEVWCSRECRLGSGAGKKKHVCRKAV